MVAVIFASPMPSTCQLPVVGNSVPFSVAVVQCGVMSGSLQPLELSTLGSSVLHYLPKFAQTHVY